MTERIRLRPSACCFRFRAVSLLKFVNGGLPSELKLRQLLFEQIAAEISDMMPTALQTSVPSQAHF
ncbi:hypothetical protein AWC19_11590 [Mycobacterium palustre]|uniref:Uncharacterized protein n=1 Tax=Mycobacterium palustre TaxID=153971 RepID=A0A1X1ZIM8_9MYCO|nr:hypothetical protein AWC19_11590 [Mycobacterium palustre]